MMHLLRLKFRFQLSSGKTILSAAFRVKLESATPVPQTQSFFMRTHNETLSIAAMRVAAADALAMVHQRSRHSSLL
jgi:hypothetical protein